MQKVKNFFKNLLVTVVVLALLLLLPIDRGFAFVAAASHGYKTSSITNDVNRYYYQNLTKTEQEAYRYICTQITDFPERIYIPKLSKDELNEVFEAVLYDNPEFWFLENYCNYESRGASFLTVCASFIPVYRCDSATYQEKQSQVEAAAEEILAAAPEGSDYEKELYIHDKLIELCDYGDPDEGSDISTLTIYGALVEHAPVCEGYAKAAQYLLTKMGIPCYVVIGEAVDSSTGTAESHMWNVVTIGGQKYCLDLTWDDHTSLGSQGDPTTPSHIYFNVTVEELSKTHTAKDSTDVAGCTHTEANYFVKEGLLFDSFGSAEQTAACQALTEALSQGQGSLELRFSSKAAMRSAEQALVQNRGIFRIISAANESFGAAKRASTSSVRYTENDSLFVLAFHFS